MVGIKHINIAMPQLDMLVYLPLQHMLPIIEEKQENITNLQK